MLIFVIGFYSSKGYDIGLMKKEWDSAVEGWTIYVSRLEGGKTETIKESFNPNFLELAEPELAFKEPVQVEGEAYVVDNNLVIALSVSASAEMPCAICNKMTKVALKVPKIYHMEPLEEIKGNKFSIKDILREAVLLEVPPFAECQEGHCTERKEMEKYFHKAKQSDTQQPFKDL